MVSYEVSETSKKIIISACNNSERQIYAKADILFFDRKGNLIGTDTVYFLYMAAGETVIKEGSNNADANSYKVIFYATE